MFFVWGLGFKDIYTETNMFERDLKSTKKKVKKKDSDTEIVIMLFMYEKEKKGLEVGGEKNVRESTFRVS